MWFPRIEQEFIRLLENESEILPMRIPWLRRTENYILVYSYSLESKIRNKTFHPSLPHTEVESLDQRL